MTREIEREDYKRKVREKPEKEREIDREITDEKGE